MSTRHSEIGTRNREDASVTQSICVITPCHNDGWALPHLAKSLQSQSFPVTKWLIVDDASDDDSRSTIRSLAETDPRFTPFFRDREPGRRIAEKANAINWAWSQSSDPTTDFVFIIDADVALPDNYIAEVINEFERNPRVGVAGGVYREVGGGTLRDLGHHVPGPAQAFRTKTWIDIEGYSPLPFGGDDVESVTEARMKGWRASRLDELTYSHLRRQGTGGERSDIKACVEAGHQDYDLGVPVWFELFKCAKASLRKPFLLGGLTRFGAFAEFAARRKQRNVSSQYVKFVRAEYRERLFGALRIPRGIQS